MKRSLGSVLVLASVLGLAGQSTAEATVTHRVLDYDGDGLADKVVVRNTGGGPTGQITWFIHYATGGGESIPWGIATDFFIPGDFDGDGKNDVTIWRPGPAGAAAFYTLRSSDHAVQAVLFGQTGDDPTICEDYDNDGITDYAVYRGGVSSGDASFWYYRKSTSPGAVSVLHWGQNGDFVAPGDYDGDHQADFVIQRNNGGGQARFWLNNTTAGVSTNVYGTPTDPVVPGDYDGDGKTDLTVIRSVGGQIYWYVLRSSDSAVTVTAWGASSTDYPTQGDYDGDGKTDIAIWRPNADPNYNLFYVLKSTGGVQYDEWGQNGDYPVANENVH